MYRREFLKLSLATLCSGVGVAAAAPAGPRRHDRDYDQDIFIDSREHGVFDSLLQRLKLVREEAGFGNFKLMGLAEATALARARRAIGAFSKAELALFERLFHQDAAGYGFRGQRVLQDVDWHIDRDQVVKLPESGNYLFRGAPEDLFRKIQADVGENIILTSGIRGVLMQTLLFLDQAMLAAGNLSRASRSVAPPAYSWHARGDFDIGVRGLGDDNFSLRLTRTPEFRRMMELGYVKNRYPRDNTLGVRFEPWHIRAV